MRIEEGDIVLCTVERIEGTVVFVKIDSNGSGTINFSEVSPGRIRNIRDFVVPKKVIICKVLRILPTGNVELSLRRVTPKEQKEMREQKKQEKSFISILRTTLNEKANPIIADLEKEGNINGKIEEFKENPEKLDKLIGKDNSKKVFEILNSQKSKIIKIRKEINLTTTKPDGLNLIKKILGNKEISVKYISAGKYSLEVETLDPKVGNNIIRDFLISIEEESKKQGLNLIVKN